MHVTPEITTFIITHAANASMPHPNTAGCAIAIFSSIITVRVATP
jgi:hypothetical protein